MTRFYTGVGQSSGVPRDILAIMYRIGYNLAARGWVGRSGSAPESDSAFESGAMAYYRTHNRGRFCSYLPWAGFNNKRYDDFHKDVSLFDNYERAVEIIKTVHPKLVKGEVMRRGPMILHTRNVYQVLGDDLETPSEMLICYAKPTETGVQGGTNTAWILAQRRGIPCFNLYNSYDRERLKFLYAR